MEQNHQCLDYDGTTLEMTEKNAKQFQCKGNQANKSNEKADPVHEAPAEVNEEKSEVEDIIFPPDFEFSEENFTSWFCPQDPLPLMPRMSTYEARLQSFDDMLDRCDKEVEFLAQMGFYFARSYELTLEEKEEMLRESDFDPSHPPSQNSYCFSCGIATYISKKFPLIIQHHLHCMFFKFPEDKEYIKKSIKPFTGVQDIDIEYLNEVRSIMFGEAAIPYTQSDMEDLEAKLPICKKCGKNEAAVKYINCRHLGYCIGCAKSSQDCLRCGKPYGALERYFYY